MSEPLNIGILGAGRICAQHATAAMGLPETTLTAIAEPEPERRQAAVASWGCRGYATIQELLGDPEVDAVVVGLPHHLHRDAAVESLESGKHVLLEKPMALSVPECDAIIAAATASGRTLMVAHSQRYFPVNLRVRQLLDEGAIGHLVGAADSWYKPFWDGARPAWFLEGSQGGGMWPMNGSHMIDRLCLFMDSRVVAVKARIGSPVFGLSASDTGYAFLEFANGLCANISHVGYKHGVNRFEAELTGTEGQLKVSGDRADGPLWRSAGEGRDAAWELVPVDDSPGQLRPGLAAPHPTFAAQLREFAAAIRDGREPAISGDYGRHVVAVMTACEESSRTGREVRLDT